MAKSLAVWISESNDYKENKNASALETEATNNEQKEKQATEPSIDTRGLELHFNYWVLNNKNIIRRVEPQTDSTWLGPFKMLFLIFHNFKNLFRWLISFAKERENTTYLDVGVRFENLTSKDTINIFFPFSISPKDYDSQLGLNLANDNQLLAAIFNSELEAIEFKDNLYHHSDINFSSKENDNGHKNGIRFFTNIDLQDTTNNPLGAGVSLHQVEKEGSILSFPIKNFRVDSNDKDGYFRFRLILNPLSKKALSTYYIPSDSFMLTTEESMEIIDFRVNEVRNTPKNVNSMLKSDKSLKKVHFFIIREVKSEYVMSGTNYARSRLLEGDMWQKYLQSQHIKPIENVPKMLIFHWKSTKENGYLENFSAFAKFRHTRHSAWIILRSIAIGLAFGIVANWLYDNVFKVMLHVS
ncbi:hypothetical protein [Dickeya zeae]|uniref:hypothetical protein n=1 Tax=Dickeya zeae TaxID=204042 RepID=UPI00030DA9BE|nr:hypothetical protein [Dickeya zeae]AJC68312.1 hypothetical protein W909_00520 [Dickeya zeae EC1]